MRKLRILIDMDDVLWDLLGTWIQYLNETYNTNVAVEDVKEWDMQKAFPTLTKLQIFIPLKTRRFWERVKPLPDAQKYLRMLMKSGHDVYLVSASTPDTIYNKVTCVLKKYFPFIPDSRLIFTNNKSLLKADVLIDDAPHNIVSWDRASILFDEPYNATFDERRYNCSRVSGWKDAYVVICGLTNGE